MGRFHCCIFFLGRSRSFDNCGADLGGIVVFDKQSWSLVVIRWKVKAKPVARPLKCIRSQAGVDRYKVPYLWPSQDRRLMLLTEMRESIANLSRSIMQPGRMETRKNAEGSTMVVANTTRFPRSSVAG